MNELNKLSNNFKLGYKFGTNNISKTKQSNIN